VSSFIDLIDALEAAGFTSCDGWSIDEFSKLAEAGVFDDAPDDAELQRRVARTLPQRVEDKNVELDITQAAEVLRTTPRALHRRIQRARERDEPHPFEKQYDVGAGKLFVKKDALIAWSKSLRGRGRPRGS
jgi:adenylate kinase family enzyme